MNVAICRYGAGNVRSVELALARLGCAPDSSPDADIAGADLVVLPGVGSARSAMAGLVERGLDVALRERVRAGRPVLGICLGLQLALDWTEEDGGVAGLGLVPGRAVRLTEGRVPRMGWAALDDPPSLGRSSDAHAIMGTTAPAASGDPTVSRGTCYYFAHSYAAESPAITAWSEGIAAEVRGGSFVGCQFHPEKSGAAGARYLAGLLDGWQPSATPPPQLVEDGWSEAQETSHQPPIATGAATRAGTRGVPAGAPCRCPA